MERIRPWRLLKETVVAWFSDNTFVFSAALAYYTAFSLAPLLLVALFVTGLFWGEQSGRIQDRVLTEVEQLIGADGAAMVKSMLEHAQQPDSGGILAAVLGMGALLFGATAVFVQLKNALNAIWHVASEGLGVKEYLLNRVLSLGMVLAVGFLLLVSLLVSVALAAADEVLRNLTPELHLLTRAADLALSLALITVLFAMIYRFLPDIEIAWRDVWVGAAITALLFSLGKYGIGAYLGNASVTSAYGAAGSFAVLLLWVYYSGLIVFFGAEFTKVYARRCGTMKEPAENHGGEPRRSVGGTFQNP